jgi:hypothetical protein
MEASWALLNPQLLTHCDIWQSWHYTFDYWVLFVFHDYTLVINACNPQMFHVSSWLIIS